LSPRASDALGTGMRAVLMISSWSVSRSSTRSAPGVFRMTATPLDLDLDRGPRLPRRKDSRIGCAGAGFIMADCHLVAYRPAGLTRVGIASRTRARADEVGARHGIPKVHTSYTELLADPSLEVLDVAVPPDAQPALIRQAVQRAGHIRGILAQ